MERTDSALFANIFGRRFADIADRNKEELRTISFTNADGTVPNELGLKLKEAINAPVFQQVQLNMLRQKIAHAAYVADEYGIKSEKGVGLVADMINQLGEGNNESAGARHYLQYALDANTEAQKLQAISKHSCCGWSRARRNQAILMDQSLQVDRMFSV
jgi:hypothetical protein